MWTWKNQYLRIVKKLKERYSIPFVIIGGDSQDEDLKMYTQNKEMMSSMGLVAVFIAPANIGKIVNDDRNIIIGNWENSDGISDCIEKLNSRIKLKEDGGIEIWKNLY